MPHRKLCRMWVFVLSMGMAVASLVMKSRSRANTEKDVRPGGMLIHNHKAAARKMTCSGFSYAKCKRELLGGSGTPTRTHTCLSL